MFSYYRIGTVIFCLTWNLVVVGFSQDFTAINRENALIQHPKISYDGTAMVFLANYSGKLQPYISTREQEGWSEPESVFNSIVSNEFDWSHPQLNYDNRTLYIAAKSIDPGSNFDIYYSRLSGGGWSYPVPLKIEGVNTSGDEFAPAFSPTEKVLLFTRPLPEEQKADDYCQELWLCQQSETGVWSKPELLGPEYNTGCVQSPYFSIDDKTFYFSAYKDVVDESGKRISKKNFNVYWAKIDGLWRFNPKYIPSILDDEDIISVSVDREGTVYYGVGDIFKSNEKKRYSRLKSTTTMDKSFAPEPVVRATGTIADISGDPLESMVSVINPFTSKILQTVNSSKDGSYQVFIPASGQFSILARKEGYSVQSKLTKTAGVEEVDVNFGLFPEVSMSFNIFDEEFYFPVGADVRVMDAEFEQIKDFRVEAREENKEVLPLGKQLYVVFEEDNYEDDTLSLPFDQEVIFNDFQFDIELVRKLRKVRLTFSDDKTGEKLGLVLTVNNVTRNEKTYRQVEDGEVILELRDGEQYEISTSAQGYSFYSTPIDLTKPADEDGMMRVDAKLKSIRGQSVVLGNINFEYNSFQLMATSYPELQKLVEYLKDNEDYRVEIMAHTDDKGTDSYNLKLSDLRATAVIEFLQDNGIYADRMIARGLGESQPLFPNDSEENMAKNRRVEFKILDGDG
jgi:outer membrane protein OmpA-like peptidoglycan-associated protein